MLYLVSQKYCHTFCLKIGMEATRTKVVTSEPQPMAARKLITLGTLLRVPKVVSFRAALSCGSEVTHNLSMSSLPDPYLYKKLTIRLVS